MRMVGFLQHAAHLDEVVREATVQLERQSLRSLRSIQCSKNYSMLVASSRKPLANMWRDAVSDFAEVPGVMSSCNASLKPRSRACNAHIAAKLPPALSPPTASLPPSSPRDVAFDACQCIAVQASSTAAGQPCSGTRRLEHFGGGLKGGSRSHG